MTIKSGQTTGLLAVGTGDTVIANPATGQSYEFYSGVLHHTGATTDPITVELFLSDDATSAAGERIQVETIDNGDEVIIAPVLVAATKYLLAKADVTGINFHGIYTRRTGSDV